MIDDLPTLPTYILLSYLEHVDTTQLPTAGHHVIHVAGCRLLHLLERPTARYQRSVVSSPPHETLII